MRKSIGKTVNIPILTNELLHTINSLKTPLPRDPNKPEESGIICVQLKRKLQYKNHHVQAWVRQNKLYEAVRILEEKIKDALAEFILTVDILLTNDEYGRAREEVARMKYYSNVLDKIYEKQAEYGMY